MSDDISKLEMVKDWLIHQDNLLQQRRYTAADMREAFVAGFEWNDEHVILTDAKAEALRRYPDKEEK